MKNEVLISVKTKHPVNVISVTEHGVLTGKFPTSSLDVIEHDVMTRNDKKISVIIGRQHRKVVYTIRSKVNKLKKNTNRTKPIYVSKQR